MASGASGEVVHCPNCKEDVPKTLYCLNCGFPLYKEEQPKEEKVEQPDLKPKPVVPDEDAMIVVDEPVDETVKPEVVAEPVHEPLQEVKPVEPIETPQPQVQVEPIPEPSAVEEKVEEKALEPTTVVVEELKPIEATPSMAEVPPTELMQETKPVETPSESLSTHVEPTETEATEMVEEIQEETKGKEYIPDPLLKDLVENLAKNISLKLKLVRLYRDGIVKEETFTRMFDEYSKEGKIWSSRREELLNKYNTDVEEIEGEYTNASDALELLEIKKSIGDVSELEYEAKAPGYRWDIEHFDYLVGDKKNRIAYLENVGGAMSNEELKELRELASLEYNTLDALQVSKDETLSSIKESLYEAIKILG
jgi:hypothetical protein